MTPTPRDPVDNGGEMSADYEALVQSAREALDDMPDLPPSQWVDIRSGVDAGIRNYQSGGSGWAWVAAAVASAAALLLSLAPLQSPLPPAQLLTKAPAVEAPVAEPVTPTRAAVLRPGQRLSAGTSSRHVDAFGRHRLTLDAGTTMAVVAWAQRDLVVRLESGRVTADIAKAFPGERIQIETATALVSVVGTQFSVTLEATGATRVDVTEGIVEVRAKHDAAAPPARVTAGQTHRVEVPAAPREVVETPAPRTSTKKRVRSKSAEKAEAPAQESERGGFRIIEIDVPPQQAPNAR